MLIPNFGDCSYVRIASTAEAFLEQFKFCGPNEGDGKPWSYLCVREAVELFTRAGYPEQIVPLLGMWSKNAYPVIQVGHKLAAALAASSVGPDVVINSPWDAFLIDVPGDMFVFDGANGHVVVSRVLVARRGGEWAYTALTRQDRSALNQWKIPHLCEAVEDRDTEEARHLSWVVRNQEAGFETSAKFCEFTPIDRRCVKLLGQFIASVCLVMSDRNSITPVGKGHTTRWRDPNTPPVVRVFQLSRPVSVDCRDAVRESIVTGKPCLRTVQWLVRGHWRNQACGKGMSERRPTWIEPYWKGPEDKPILFRPHVVSLPREVN